MRKIHSLGLVGAVALVLAAVVAPAANGAVTRVETDQFSGVASAQALDLSLLGRRLTFGIASVDSAANVVNNTLNQKASGIGTLLSPRPPSRRPKVEAGRRRSGLLPAPAR